MIVGQGFPVRQQAHLEAGRKPRDFLQQALGVGSAGGNDGEQAALALTGQFGQCQGIGGTGQRWQIDAGAGLGQGGEGKQRAGNGHGRSVS